MRYCWIAAEVEGGYIIEDFPQGYEMYDHHKGVPGPGCRHDMYLWGKLLRPGSIFLTLTAILQGPKTPADIHGGFARCPSFFRTRAGYTTSTLRTRAGANIALTASPSEKSPQLWALDI